MYVCTFKCIHAASMNIIIMFIILHVELSCETLQDPANGRVQVSGDIPGAVASYTCNPGFSLVGQSRRTCQRDGSFSGQAPTCRCEYEPEGVR